MNLIRTSSFGGNERQKWLQVRAQSVTFHVRALLLETQTLLHPKHKLQPSAFNPTPETDRDPVC